MSEVDTGAPVSDYFHSFRVVYFCRDVFCRCRCHNGGQRVIAAYGIANMHGNEGAHRARFHSSRPDDDFTTDKSITITNTFVVTNCTVFVVPNFNSHAVDNLFRILFLYRRSGKSTLSTKSTSIPTKMTRPRPSNSVPLPDPT
jgi:ribosomal protein L35AE/L33A